MTFEEIKPDIFDINRDMPTVPASPSLPRLSLLTVVRYGGTHAGVCSRVHIIYQIGLKLDQKDPSVMFKPCFVSIITFEYVKNDKLH